jgi:hypothetical protein
MARENSAETALTLERRSNEILLYEAQILDYQQTLDERIKGVLSELWRLLASASE